MHPTTRRTALAAAAATAVIALIPVPAFAIEARLPSPGGGTLVMVVPDGWRQNSKPAKTPTMAFRPPADEAFLVLVSNFLPRTGPKTPAALRKLMDAMVAEARPKAVEANLSVQELRGAVVQGLYFSATDKAPKPGEYRYITQGAMLVKGMPAVFTILTNDDSKAAVELALRMFSSARRS